MDANLALFLIIGITVAAALALPLLATSNRSSPSSLVESAASDGADLMIAENSRLRGQIARLEERLSSLERQGGRPALRGARSGDLN